MEPLLAQLKSLPVRFQGLQAKTRWIAAAAAVSIVGVIGLAGYVAQAEGRYEYVFTRLTPEDQTAAAVALKQAGIAFRVEAGAKRWRWRRARSMTRACSLPHKDCLGPPAWGSNCSIRTIWG